VAHVIEIAERARAVTGRDLGFSAEFRQLLVENACVRHATVPLAKNPCTKPTGRRDECNEQLSDANDFVVVCDGPIAGIPYFYRQFGYDYALLAHLRPVLSARLSESSLAHESG
jgi:hypothetical protein